MWDIGVRRECEDKDAVDQIRRFGELQTLELPTSVLQVSPDIEPTGQRPDVLIHTFTQLGHRYRMRARLPRANSSLGNYEAR